MPDQLTVMEKSQEMDLKGKLQSAGFVLRYFLLHLFILRSKSKPKDRETYANMGCIQLLYIA